MDQLPLPCPQSWPFAEGSRALPYVVSKGSKGELACPLPGATTL